MNFSDDDDEFQDAVLRKSSNVPQPAQHSTSKRTKFVDNDISEHFESTIMGFSRSVPRGSVDIVKKRGKGKKWSEVRSFPDDSAWESFKKDRKFMDDWSIINTQKVKFGSITLFYCRPFKNVQCPAQMRLERLEYKDGLELNLQSADIPHCHVDPITQQPAGARPCVGIPGEQKHIVDSNRDSVMPSRMKKKIRSQGLDSKDITVRQIYNRLAYLKRKERGTKKGNYLGTSDLYRLQEKYHPDKAQTENDACIFLLYIKHGAGKDGQVYFALFISTSKLMKYAAQFGNCKLDATWKILLNGQPMFFPSIGDGNGKTWVAGVFVASDEITLSYELQLQCLKYIPGLLGHSGPFSLPMQIEPAEPTSEGYIPWGKGGDCLVNNMLAVMGDGAEMITNAQCNELPNAARAMCWPHTYRAYTKHLKSVPSAEVRVLIDHQIKQLQLARTTPEFQSACPLMIEGWKAMLQEPAILATAIVTFANYFTLQHGPTSHASNWFEGFLNFHSSNNTGQEAKHKYIKAPKGPLQGKRHQLDSCIHVMAEECSAWSIDIDENTQDGIRYTVLMDLQTETEGFMWYQQARNQTKPIYLTYQKDGGTIFLVIPESVASSYPNDLTKCEHMLQFFAFHTNFSSFQQYIQCRFSVWVVKWVYEGCIWSCTCPVWMKKRMCKHEVGLKAIANLHIFSQASKNVPVGSRRRPGRPLQIPIRQSLQLDPFCLPIPSTNQTIHSDADEPADDGFDAGSEEVFEADESGFHEGTAAFALVSDQHIAEAKELFRTLFG